MSRSVSKLALPHALAAIVALAAFSSVLAASRHAGSEQTSYREGDILPIRAACWSKAAMRALMPLVGQQWTATMRSAVRAGACVWFSPMPPGVLMHWVDGPVVDANGTAFSLWEIRVMGVERPLWTALTDKGGRHRAIGGA